jgi:SOS response associated peptidase (SRAP)
MAVGVRGNEWPPSIDAGGTRPWPQRDTGEPNELVAQIHNRMPIILPPETHEQWLSGEFGKEILRPFAAKEMTARPISKRINKPENNDPSVLEEGEMEQIGWLI